MLPTLMLVLAVPVGGSPRDALKPFNLFVGTWKGTGIVSSKTDDFWSETVVWEWRFSGDDVALVGSLEKGRHARRFELRYRPAKGPFQLTVVGESESHEYTGTLAAGRGTEQVLTVERTDTEGVTHRLVFTLLHANRYLYRAESRAAGTSSFVRTYQVGVTKNDGSFVAVPKGPECVVSGGLGTIKVMHNGKTYYVCCSGCRDAFLEDPSKFVK